MCFFTRLNSLDVQIQVYFTLRTVTVGSHVFDMLSVNELTSQQVATLLV